MPDFYGLTVGTQQKAKAEAKKAKATNAKNAAKKGNAFAVMSALQAGMLLVAQYGKGPAKSAGEVLAWRELLDTIMLPGAAAVLSAWIGGAPPKASQSWTDKRQSAETTAAKQTKGAKQYTVKNALAELGKLSPELRQMVASKGLKKELKASKNQQENVDQAVDKIVDDISDAIPTGFKLGAGLVAVVVVGLLLLKVTA
jgi:hypothetical protein